MKTCFNYAENTALNELKNFINNENVMNELIKQAETETARRLYHDIDPTWTACGNEFNHYCILFFYKLKRTYSSKTYKPIKNEYILTGYKLVIDDRASVYDDFKRTCHEKSYGNNYPVSMYNDGKIINE